MLRLLILLLFACGCSNISTTTPVKIEPPHDVCDYCNYGHNVVVYDANKKSILIKPGDSVTFEIDLTKDNYTKSGGWYWLCGITPMRSKIPSAKIVKMTRDNNGNVYWLAIKGENKNE